MCKLHCNLVATPPVAQRTEIYSMDTNSSLSSNSSLDIRDDDSLTDMTGTHTANEDLCASAECASSEVKAVFNVHNEYSAAELPAVNISTGNSGPMLHSQTDTFVTGSTSSELWKEQSNNSNFSPNCVAEKTTGIPAENTQEQKISNDLLAGMESKELFERQIVSFPMTESRTQTQSSSVIPQEELKEKTGTEMGQRMRHSGSSYQSRGKVKPSHCKFVENTKRKCAKKQTSRWSGEFSDAEEALPRIDRPPEKVSVACDTNLMSMSSRVHGQGTSASSMPFSLNLSSNPEMQSAGFSKSDIKYLGKTSQFGSVIRKSSSVKVANFSNSVDNLSDARKEAFSDLSGNRNNLPLASCSISRANVPMYQKTASGNKSPLFQLKEKVKKNDSASVGSIPITMAMTSSSPNTLGREGKFVASTTFDDKKSFGHDSASSDAILLPVQTPPFAEQTGSSSLDNRFTNRLTVQEPTEGTVSGIVNTTPFQNSPGCFGQKSSSVTDMENQTDGSQSSNQDSDRDVRHMESNEQDWQQHHPGMIFVPMPVSVTGLLAPQVVLPFYPCQQPDVGMQFTTMDSSQDVIEVEDSPERVNLGRAVSVIEIKDDAEIGDNQQPSTSAGSAGQHPGLDFGIQTVLEIFPEADTNFVRQILKDFLVTDNLDRAVARAMNLLLDTPPPPLPPLAAQQQEVTVEKNRLAGVDDYYNCIERPKYDKVKVLQRLSMDFRNIRQDTIQYVLGHCNGHYAPAHRILTRARDSALAANTENRLRGKRKNIFPLELTFPENERANRNDYFLMKSARPFCQEKMDVADPLLLSEIEFVEQQLQMDKEDLKLARSLFDAECEYEDRGQLIECGCCFSDQAFENMIQCFEGHLFCKQCLANYAKEAVFGNGKLILNCLTADCDSLFPKSQLTLALPQDLLYKYEERLEEENLMKAGMPDLFRCPFCNMAVVLDLTVRVLKCPKSTCRKESCRDCKQNWEDHIGKTCEEVEKKDETQLRINYEEKMTAARVRTCASCQAQFFKEEGCNRMTCRCGAAMCYICRYPNIQYSHFCDHPRDPGKGCTTCKKCSLWTNTDEDEKRAIVEMQKEAQEKRKQQGYTEDRLIGAPEEPTPSKKSKKK